MQKKQIIVSKQPKLFRLGTACAGEGANCSEEFLLAIREHSRSKIISFVYDTLMLGLMFLNKWKQQAQMFPTIDEKKTAKETFFDKRFDPRGRETETAAFLVTTPWLSLSLHEPLLRVPYGSLLLSLSLG